MEETIYSICVMLNKEWVTIARGKDQKKMDKAYKALKAASAHIYIFMDK